MGHVDTPTRNSSHPLSLSYCYYVPNQYRLASERARSDSRGSTSTSMSIAGSVQGVLISPVFCVARYEGAVLRV